MKRNRGVAALAEGYRSPATELLYRLTPTTDGWLTEVQWADAWRGVRATCGAVCRSVYDRLARKVDEAIATTHAAALASRDAFDLAFVREVEAKSNGAVSRHVARLPVIDRAIINYMTMRAKRRIVNDRRAGVIPSVKRFSTLHNRVDANLYFLTDAGDFDATLEAFAERHGVPSVDEEYVNVLNDNLMAAMDNVDAWLRTGVLARVPVKRGIAPKRNGAVRVGTLEGWNTTTYGYQQSKIDGVVYLTLIDVREMPGFTRGARVEYQTDLPPEGHSLPYAHVLRVVGHADLPVVEKTRTVKVGGKTYTVTREPIGGFLSMYRALEPTRLAKRTHGTIRSLTHATVVKAYRDGAAPRILRSGEYDDLRPGTLWGAVENDQTAERAIVKAYGLSASQIETRGGTVIARG